MESVIICGIFALILSVREYFFMQKEKLWTVERQKLIDRIQAKDFVEYKKYEEQKEPKEDKEDKKEYEWI